MNTEDLPFVSVIVPVFNGSRTLRKCLEAVTGQAYPGSSYEVIVVDNKSTDQSRAIASSCPGVKLLRQDSIQSSYASRNLGSAQARGEILVFMDADCIPSPDWLLNLVIPFADRGVLAVGGTVLDVEPANLVEIFIQETNLLRKYQSAENQYFKPLITANVAIRKTAFDALGGFNENLYTGGDIDLAWRAQLKYGDCVRYSAEAVVFHRHRSTLKNMFRQYRRHGFGEIFLDAMYHTCPGYPRTLSYQLRQINRQVWSLLKNIRSFLFRLLRYPFKPDLYYLLQPLFWFVAESGNVWGKIQALWGTRLFRLNPALHPWQDPGG
jgi:cellulose synthase/poly-beta-1,6-N-acetylglucosamine synthase-like glycosyltransferase